MMNKKIIVIYMKEIEEKIKKMRKPKKSSKLKAKNRHLCLILNAFLSASQTL